MAEESQEWELEAAGHIVSAVRRQRERWMLLLTSILFIYFASPTLLPTVKVCLLTFISLT